jgi:hypothetical protein
MAGPSSGSRNRSDPQSAFSLAAKAHPLFWERPSSVLKSQQQAHRLAVKALSERKIRTRVVTAEGARLSHESA